jgi:hypothetical protein
LKDIEKWHKLRWPEFISSLGWHIGYHYVIDGEGVVTQTRRDNELGAHCIPNEGKLGIALTGNFEVEKPSEGQLNALQLILDKLQCDYLLDETVIYAHCEKSQTLCPGKNLMEWLNLYRKLTFLQKLVKKLKSLLKVD